MEHMNIRQIAELCGKTERTVYRWLENDKLSDKVSLKELYTFDEVETILSIAFTKEIANVLMQNVRQNVRQNVNSKSISVDDEFSLHMIKAVQALEKKVNVNTQMIKAQNKYLYDNVERQKSLPSPIDEEKEELKRRLRYAEESLSLIQDKLSGKGTKYDPDGYFWNK